jgi:hypothetical protein
MTEPSTTTQETRELKPFSGSAMRERLSSQEVNSMTRDYDGFRGGMLRAAEMARNEFKQAPEAAKGHDCVYVSGYEDACDHLSVVIARAAVINSVRPAGAQPDWQYHISLLLPDGEVEDAALLKIFQVVEHELRLARAPSDTEQRLRAEIERLQNELKTARHDTFNEAAQIAGDFHSGLHDQDAFRIRKALYKEADNALVDSETLATAK